MRKSGGCVNGTRTMNGKQRLLTGQMEVAVRSVIGGNNQIKIRLFWLINGYMVLDWEITPLLQNIQINYFTN